MTRKISVFAILAILLAGGAAVWALFATEDSPAERDWVDQVDSEFPLVALAEPLTAADVDYVLDSYDALRGSAEYTRWRQARRELHEDHSLLGVATLSFREQAERDATAALEMAYYRTVADHGHEQHRGSLVRIAGAAAAARQVASERGLSDPGSDEVARFMFEARPAARQRLDRTLAAAPPDALDKRGTPDPELDELIGEPGTIALAHMPEASIRQWHELAPALRRRLVGLPDEASRDYPDSVLPLLWDGAPDFVSAQITSAFRAR